MVHVYHQNTIPLYENDVIVTITKKNTTIILLIRILVAIFLQRRRYYYDGMNALVKAEMKKSQIASIRMGLVISVRYEIKQVQSKNSYYQLKLDC